MGAVSLDDGGWGSIAANFASALSPDPSNRAKMMLMGEQYRKLQLEQEEQRRKMEAIAGAVRAYPNTLPKEVTLPPIDGQEEFGPARPEVQRDYTGQREKAIAYQAAAANLAKSSEDFAKGVFGTEGMNAIAGGIPSDPRRQDVINTYAGLIGTSLPNYTTTPHTYQSTDAAGTALGAPVTSRRIPGGPSTMVSPGKAGPANPFENDAASDKRLFDLSQKAARDPASLTIPELEEAAVHLTNRHGVKASTGKGPDGSTTMTMVRERPYPEQYNPLVSKVAELNWWRAESEAARREGRPMREPPVFGPPATVAPSPDATTGGLVGGPVAAPVPGAAAPPAVAPTVGGLPLGTDVGKPTQIAAGDATPVRKEFNDQPSVVSYYKAIGPYKQFSENIKVGTPQADVSMIYNLAKMLDPDSVVRDAEMITWKKSGGPLDQLRGLYDKIISDKAALTPKVRANLADMAERVMGATHGEFKEQAERYREIATDYGIRPELVVPKTIPDLPKIDRKTISSITPAGPGPRGAPETSTLTTAPAAAPAAPGGARGRTIRVNPTTGAIEDVP